MKGKPFHLVLVLGVALSGTLAYGQASSSGAINKKPRTVEDYKPYTLREILLRDSTRDGLLTFRVRVSYTASERPISSTSSDALHDWERCCAGNPDHYKNYKREMQFVEDGAAYWLAVEDELIADFRKEVQVGEVVDLFLIRLSPPKTNTKSGSVLLVERFQRAGTNSDHLEPPLDWIRSNLPLYTEKDLEVEASGHCQLQITDLSSRAGVSKAVVFVPLSDLDASKVSIQPQQDRDVWRLRLYTHAGKSSIRFMLYQGGPAEGGQAGEYSLTFRERVKAEAMAGAFRRAIHLCAAAKLPKD